VTAVHGAWHSCAVHGAAPAPRYRCFCSVRFRYEFVRYLLYGPGVPLEIVCSRRGGNVARLRLAARASGMFIQTVSFYEAKPARIAAPAQAHSLESSPPASSSVSLQMSSRSTLAPIDSIAPAVTRKPDKRFALACVSLSFELSVQAIISK
jgi:hypothetical protein